MNQLKFGVIALMLFSLPFQSFAAGKFYYAAWLPYWKDQEGAQDAARNLDKFQEISPFSYEVGSNGTILDKLKITQGLWPGWLGAAKDMGIKVIPTIAWFDGGGIHALLLNDKKRIAHEDAIAKLVKDKKFDGIDIDYEGKMSKTSPYFSLLVKGLAIRLHPMKKMLSCTVEARTPLTSVFETVPSDIHFANDYAVLNKYCDEVRIMTYDQGTVDLKLDAQKGNGELYAPVADADWTKKVIQETLKTISPKKVMLGIPTYGYEYEVTWQDGVTTYRRLRSHNFFQAMDRAESVGLTPVRNSAGELGFTYATSSFVDGVSSYLTFAITSTRPTAVVALGINAPVTRFVSFSDAAAAAQKIALAKKFGLRGVAFFKFDGSGDPLLWEVMQ